MWFYYSIFTCINRNVSVIARYVSVVHDLRFNTIHKISLPSDIRDRLGLWLLISDDIRLDIKTQRNNQKYQRPIHCFATGNNESTCGDRRKNAEIRSENSRLKATRNAPCLTYTLHHSTSLSIHNPTYIQPVWLSKKISRAKNFTFIHK